MSNTDYYNIPPQNITTIALSKIFGFPIVGRVYRTTSDNDNLCLQLTEGTIYKISKGIIKIFSSNIYVPIYLSAAVEEYHKIETEIDNILSNHAEIISELVQYCKTNNINIPNFSDDVRRIIEVTLSGNHRL